MKPPAKPTGAEPKQSVPGMELDHFTDLHNSITRILLKHVSAERRQDVPDLLQEAYVRYLAQSQKEGADVIRDPSGYIFKIVVNLAAEQVRREDRALLFTELGSRHMDSHLSDSAGTSWSPVVDTTGEIDDLINAINRLPKLRRAILLLEIVGHSRSDIARELKISEHTVKKYLKEVRADLRNQLYGRKARASSANAGGTPVGAK